MKKYGPLIMSAIVVGFIAVHLFIAFHRGSLPVPWKGEVPW